MLPQLTSIAHLYAVDDRMLDRCVGDFAPTDWLFRDGAGHDARWIMGHIALYRQRLVGMLGAPPIASDLERYFGSGSRPEAVPASVQGADLVRAFHEAHQVMTGRWEAQTEADLAKPLGRTLRDGGDTIGAGLRFLQWHETYHLGQLGLLRRLMGKPGIA